MHSPAISRYGATAPELLRWFDGFNTDLPYRDQVKPFGFLLSLHAKREWKGGEVIAPQSRRGRPAKFQPPKPVAPFDRDPAKIAAAAFDRINGQPVPADALQTYAEALAQYHLHPESKFLGGSYCDRGTTQRRHVRVSGIAHIGKEANELDRQQVLGVDAHARPDYGLADDSLARLKAELSGLVDRLGNAGAAKSLRIPSRRLRSILSDTVCPNGSSLRFLLALVPVASAQAEKLHGKRDDDLQRLRKMIDDVGLRGAARLLGVDPSNLRRRVKRHRGISRTQEGA